MRFPRIALRGLPEPYARLVLPVYLPSFLMAVSSDALLILLPLYVLELGYGPVFAALAVGLRGVGVLLFDVPAGVLVARIGEKSVLLIGLTSVAAGLILLALTSSPWFIGLAAVLLGIGFAAWMLGRQSYIAATCEISHMGRAIALMAGIQRSGAFVGPLLGGLIAQQTGFSFAFLFCCVCAIAAGIAVSRFAADIETTGEAHSAITGSLEVIRDHARVFATAGLSASILQLMRATRQLLVPLFGQTVGLDVAAIGAIYSISAAIDMCLFYPVGIVVDRFGRKFSAIPALFFFAVGLVLLPLANSVSIFIAAALLLGFANGCGTGIVMIMGADLSQRLKRRSQFLGVWRLMGDGGMTSAPLLTSAITNLAGLAAASWTVAGFGFVGVAIMVFLVADTRSSV